MTTPVAYLNGRFLPFAEASLPLHDAGFVSGATVVDNARTYGRKLFRWADHLARFRRDCATCYVPLTATDAELTAVAGELVARNGALLPPDGELQVVTFATPGPLGFYVGEPANGPPTLGMATYPVPERYARFAADGVVLAVAGKQTAQADDLLPPRVKHRSRMMWHVADQTVRAWAEPGTVPAIVAADGAIDTPIGVVVAVTWGAVYFPREGSVLESITLTVVGELCDRLDIPTARYGGSVVQLAEVGTELILCGSGCGVVGVRGFCWSPRRQRAFPPFGPVLTRLRAAWAEETGERRA